MNSLSLLSSRVDKVIGATPPPTPRTESFKSPRHDHHTSSLAPSERAYLARRGVGEAVFYENEGEEGDEEDEEDEDDEDDEDEDNEISEQEALLYSKRAQSLVERIYIALLSPWLGVFRWFISTLVASTDWFISCVYDEQGVFSPSMPAQRVTALILRPFKGSHDSVSGFPSAAKPQYWPSTSSARHVSDEKGGHHSSDPAVIPISPIHHSRSRSISHDSNSLLTEEIVPQRSIRIRLYNEDSAAKSRSSSVKSPTSPSSGLRLTKYPRNSGPPKPLLPSHPPPKTLILDLDETLIHSLAKGGRMTSGHMVEVKLDRQHAILYYVHKRPHCDDFLRKVCKWYNLVVFTASVQEYADPVIDWLEQDRKYFKGRYYRQHCTQRNGAYIKDLSAVEPDLSKVMIIDNSPTSYCFHEDNAIPIEGWINDPTDIDLLHLIPLLEALQYATDVRALLALRMGETG